MKLLFSFLLVFGSVVFFIVDKESKSFSDETNTQVYSTVLAFGDSLTYGYGVKKAFSYPSYMAKKTGLKVINEGISGEVSADGLKRLAGLLELHEPDMVILCHGGNDIIKKRSMDALKDNLKKMITLIRRYDAKVLLVGVPELSYLGFKTHSLYEDVAKEMNVLYEGEVLEKIENDRSLKSDYIHPNAKGYEKMADAFIEFI